jgi:NAD(P)-dependent dehydrogenase (short-subunit alcohol dehydrogenase family)
MKESGGGSIVNISSMAGLVASSRAPAYGASKGAVRLLTKSIAVQYGSDGIRCNSVHPGLIEETGMGDRLIEKAGNMILAGTPLGIYGTPRDIALGVLFLASDESSYITGSELVIDGGITAK